MQEWLVKFKEWWSQLALREKRAVAIGGSLLGIFIIYQGIWSPLVNHVAAMRNRITTNQKTLVWMQEADKEIKKGETNTKNKTKAISPVVLLSLLQKNINRFGLESQLTQLKQAANDSVEMHFQKVEFDKLMTLLITLAKEQNVTIVQMSAIAENTPGIVNADIVIK